MEKFHPSAKRSWLLGLAGLIAALAAVQAILPLLQLPLNPLVAFLPVLAFAAVYLAVSTATAYLTTYCLENGAIVMEKKMLSEDRQIIPIKNIDNLHIKSGLLGRLLSLSDVYVDTPGGFGYEMVMYDIPNTIADVLIDEVEKIKKGV